VHRDGFHREFQFAGLHPGDVDQFVDEGEQVLAGGEDPVSAVAVVLVQVRHLQELGEAEDRVERVRSSWLVRDRKVFFVALACSA